MAVTLTGSALAQALAVNQALADRLLPVAVALVEQYAPGAPESIQNEAAIRAMGWLAEHPSAALRSETTGDIRTSYDPGMTSAGLHSGAWALLSPYKVRRAGAI